MSNPEPYVVHYSNKEHTLLNSDFDDWKSATDYAVRAIELGADKVEIRKKATKDKCYCYHYICPECRNLEYWRMEKDYDKLLEKGRFKTFKGI